MIYELGGEHPEIAADAWVTPDANVIGRVRLLAAASVWFGSVLRGDTEWITIGAGSNIQDMSVLHTDVGAELVVGDGVTVGHRVTLHGCRVGDNALIGMGSIILNHAVIGENSIIGAGSLVTEGKEIPPGVLALGTPAKVVRDLSDEERALISASARHYQANAERFRAELREIS